MAFAGRPTTPLTSGTPATTPPPPPPGANPPPPPPPVGRPLWVGINGQTQAKTEAEARLLPPTTPAMFQGDAAWSTIGALFPAAAAQRPFGAPGQPAAPSPGIVPVNLFAGVENAQVIRRGNNITPGDYVAKLLSAEFKQGRKGNYMILELQVLVSSYIADNPQFAGCNPEGSTITVFVKQNDSFLGNVKEIVLAVSGFDDQGHSRDETDPVTQDECNQLVSPAQPFAGAVVYMEARQIKTKAGGDFTRVNWWPCPLKKDAAGTLVPDLDRLTQTRG